MPDLDPEIMEHIEAARHEEKPERISSPKAVRHEDYGHDYGSYDSGRAECGSGENKDYIYSDPPTIDGTGNKLLRSAQTFVGVKRPGAISGFSPESDMLEAYYRAPSGRRISGGATQGCDLWPSRRLRLTLG